VEEIKQEGESSFSPSNNRRRKSQKKERKMKDKKKSRSNNLRDGLKQMQTQKIEELAEESEDPQYKVFQDKWKKRQKNTVHNKREFNSVLTLKKQLSQSDQSQDPLPRYYHSNNNFQQEKLDEHEQNPPEPDCATGQFQAAEAKRQCFWATDDALQAAVHQRRQGQDRAEI